MASNADKLFEYASKDDMDLFQEKEAEKQRSSAIAEITRELGVCLQKRITEKNESGDALFNSIAKMWAQREQEELRRKRMMITSTSSKRADRDGEQTWNWQTLEQSLAEKKMELDSTYTDADPGLDLVLEKTESGEVAHSPQMLPTAQQMAAQMTVTAATPRSRSDLLPLPVSYRARVSRRCRAELAAGRTGILIKPKVNPLDGDTSLRAGHGQWWKKDSSAVHVVPRVQLCRHGADGQKRAALLKVKNPTMNMIRLRLCGTEAVTIDERELRNILVDPFVETFVQGRLCAPDAIDATDFLVLEPADDPFLEIGKGREDDPPDVRGWDAVAALGAVGSGSSSRLRVVATLGDAAWIEFILWDIPSEEGVTEATDYLAVPLALQIEVGNGSWESSLIKQRDLPEGEKDLVTLNLVALLRGG